MWHEVEMLETIASGPNLQMLETIHKVQSCLKQIAIL